MPPGSAKKGTKKEAAKKGTAPKKSDKRRSPRCKTCGRTIRVPEGWTAGPAVRRHYWAKHRSVMQPELGKDR